MQKTERDIVHIKVNQIYPHPDNPRKDVGDVTELAESIKKNGIMQNLTVIPIGALDEEAEKQSAADNISLLSDFIVLIGHRRLAASIKAGLDRVPCKIVSNISKREQVAIMLEENIQRNDLTIYEQAQGFQMMLDLGETAETIAEKTGFSKTTVYHRINLAKLDQEELKKKQDGEAYQISLKDFYELEKISSVEKRNEILAASATSHDIAWRVKNALEEEKREKIRLGIISLLEKAGIKGGTDKQKAERYSSKWSSKWMYYRDGIPEKLDFEGEKDRFYIVEYSYIAVYEKKETEETRETEKTQEQLRRERINDNRENLRNIERNMAERRKEFVESIISDVLKAGINEEVKDRIWRFFLREDGEVVFDDYMEFILGKESWNCTSEEKSDVVNKLQQMDAGKIMLIALHCSMSSLGSAVGWNCEYDPCEIGYYKEGNDILAEFGWYLLEEEQQVLDGTHELYEKEEAGDQSGQTDNHV